MKIEFNDLAKKIIEAGSRNPEKQIWVMRTGMEASLSLEGIDLTENGKYAGQIEEAINQLLDNGYIVNAYRRERYSFTDKVINRE